MAKLPPDAEKNLDPAASRLSFEAVLAQQQLDSALMALQEVGNRLDLLNQQTCERLGIQKGATVLPQRLVDALDFLGDGDLKGLQEYVAEKGGPRAFFANDRAVSTEPGQ